MKGSRARVFVALDPPAWVSDELGRWARGALRGRGGLRVLDPEGMHVTLCFLGHRPLDELADIGTLTLECARAVDELELGAPLWLPPRRPRALSIEVHDRAHELAALQADVSRALSEGIGWQPERRAFRPHLTVARMREGAGPRDRQLPPTPQLAFAGESLTLYRSHLARDGATYEPLARAELAGAA